MTTEKQIAKPKKNRLNSIHCPDSVTGVSALRLKLKQITPTINDAKIEIISLPKTMERHMMLRHKSYFASRFRPTNA